MARSVPPIPRRSAWIFSLFLRYTHRYVARHFHTVRLARGGYRPDPANDLPGSVLVVVNHPSWWDPLVGLLVLELWTDRIHFAPIDAAGLAKYPFLERLGFFGIERGTARGGRTFLRSGLAILKQPQAMLWVTPQGRFTDPRVRPTRLEAGVGHLASRLGAGYAIPLAIEYGFWNERSPEALCRLGPPIALSPGPGQPSNPAEWTARLEQALEAAQDALAADALSRDPARFEVLLSGRVGVGGIYDAWRRLAALVRGRRFEAGHGSSGEEIG